KHAEGSPQAAPGRQHALSGCHSLRSGFSASGRARGIHVRPRGESAGAGARRSGAARRSTRILLSERARAPPQRKAAGTERVLAPPAMGGFEERRLACERVAREILAGVINGEFE